VQQLSGSPLVSYLWTGPSSFSSAQQAPQRTPVSLACMGMYTVSVTDENQCSSSSTINVVVLPKPALITLSSAACLHKSGAVSASGAYSYQWSNGNTIALNTAVLMINDLTMVGSQVYTVIGTGLNSCTASATATLQVFPSPVLDIKVSPSATICQNQHLLMEASGAKSYYWNGPDLTTSSKSDLSFPRDGTVHSGYYLMYGIDEHGCGAEKKIYIKVLDLPLASVIGPTAGCAPFCGEYKLEKFNNTGPLVNFQWSMDEITSPVSSLSYCFKSGGNYRLTALIEDSSGCSNSVFTTIVAHPKPVASFRLHPNKPLDNEEPVLFVDETYGNNLQNWSWSLVEQKDDALVFNYSGQVVQQSFDHPGSFVMAMVVKDKNGCSDTAVSSFFVEEDFALYVPNAFTPNSDEINEVFKPVSRGVREIKFEVYDRWGEKVFQSADSEKGWDGTFKGSECKPDVYSWKLHAISNPGKSKELTGSVTLLR
jgi:gliding motility-associated-like protein